MVPDDGGAPRVRNVADRGRRGDGGPRLSVGQERGDGDGTPEGCGEHGRPRRDALRRGGRPTTLGANGQFVVLETNDHGAIEVRPQDTGPGRREPVQGRSRRMAIGIARPGRGHRDPRSHGVDERLGRGGLAPVMGDLEQINVRQTLRQQLGVDRLLDVAHQQEAAASHLAEQDDRHVVDSGPAVRRLDRHLAADGPQDAERNVVHLQSVTRGETTADRCARPRQTCDPGGITWPRTTHPGLEDPTNVVAVQQQREAGDVILVRVGEDDRVDPTVPGRDVLVEHNQQPIGIRTAIDQQTRTTRPFDQDAVALPDVEDRHPRKGTWTCGDHAAGDRDRDDQGHRCGSLRAPLGLWSRAGR
jgi:hypothetical protein